MFRLLAASWLLLLAAPSWGQEPYSADGPGPCAAVVLSPLPDSAVSGDEPLEVSVLLEGAAGLSIKLYIDSIDVSSRADITEDYVFYLSDEPPGAGLHALSLLGVLDGDTLLLESWSFMGSPAASGITAGGGLPWEASVGLGWQHGWCDRDTSGLGLSTPIGHQPSGEAFFSGQLWGGFVQGNVSYDLSYDSHPHGLLQASLPGLELSLGEFDPGLSSLAFANALPLGLLARKPLGPVTLDLTACRTASADTTLSSFAQYLYGGRVGIELKDSLFLGMGYLQGHDQASSLPDSVRYRTSTLVLADTIFGLTDTLIYVDSLHPAGNRIGWLSVSKAFGPYVIGLEAAGTRTTSDCGEQSNGLGYLARASRFTPACEFSLAYSSTDAGFRSFGSPYLETSKNEVECQIQAGWPGKARSMVQGSVYKVFTDSAPGLSWRFGAGWSLRAGAFSNLSLGFDYSIRPYRDYLSQSRGFNAGLGFSALGFGFNGSYGYNSSSSPGTTQSHNVSAEASRPLYRRLASVSLGHQYYQTRDASGSSDRDKHSLTAAVSGELTSSLTYRLQARRISQADRIEPGQSYRQSLAAAGLSWRF